MFLDLLKYVNNIKDEKEKIKRFLCVPTFHKVEIQFNECKTLEYTTRKINLYDHRKGEENFYKSWKNKKKDKHVQRKKGFQPPFLGTILIHIDKDSHMRVILRWSNP